MIDEASPRDAAWHGWVATLGSGAVATLTAIDLATDRASGTSAAHVVIEAIVIAIATVAAIGFARRAWRLRQRARRAEATAVDLAGDVAAARADAERWRTEAGALVRGLADAIDRQLMAWQLTPSEAEVARLLLKGLSHKEIAGVRGGSEATARQQATVVYRKAGLAGRAELAAFFLEDLLAPRAP